MDPRALAAAVVAKAQTSPQFLTFRMGEVESRPAKGYAVLYFNPGSPFGDRHSGGANRLRWSFRAKCVGYSDDQCLFVAGKVRDLFLCWPPDPGSSAGWLTEVEDDPPLIPDTLEGDTRYSTTLTFTLTTSRS